VAVVIEDFDAVSVLDEADFLIDGGDAVAQVDLDSGDVGDFEDAATAMPAGDEGKGACGAENDCGRAQQKFGEEFHANV
jgi:hypothetical protein